MILGIPILYLSLVKPYAGTEPVIWLEGKSDGLLLYIQCVSTKIYKLSQITKNNLCSNEYLIVYEFHEKSKISTSRSMFCLNPEMDKLKHNTNNVRKQVRVTQKYFIWI